LKIYSVGEFSQRMHGVFDRVRAFDSIAVSGEVSEWTPRANLIYFTLKDARAVLQCVAYPSRAQKFPPINPGSAIVAQGRVRVAEWRSRYELLVESVQLTGIGELFRQYEELKERFRRLGYFDREHKLPIPAFPRVVGLVSARGKGAEDFLTTLRERAPQVQIEFIETRVQGFGADVEIADALDRAARRAPDVIVLARGGGSYEDLFAFNCEPVVRAVWRGTIPIITAIGHTADHHLADEVADYVCETPSNAAQFIASLWQRGGDRLARLTLQLDRDMAHAMGMAAGRCDTLDERLAGASHRMLLERRRTLETSQRALDALNPALQLARRGERLTRLHTTLIGWPIHAVERWCNAVDIRTERIGAMRTRTLDKRKNLLALAQSRLTSSDPRKPLERGYAIVSLKGRALRDARDAARGDEIEARLYHGSLKARVESIMTDEKPSAEDL
jgi:exodeoxyribonuclease VII large subunit